MLTKPVALYDVDGYWQPLLAALDVMTERGFLAERLRAALIVENEPEALLEAVQAWVSPPPKWRRQA